MDDRFMDMPAPDDRRVGDSADHVGGMGMEGQGQPSGGTGQTGQGGTASSAASATASSTSASKKIVIEVPTLSSGLLAPFAGLGAVINALLVFAGWMIVGIGYLCVPGSVVGGFFALVLAGMNLANGAAAVALLVGIGLACLGMCVPILLGTRLLRHALAKASSVLVGMYHKEGR